MMRRGKLTKDEENTLAHLLLRADESYFDIKLVKVRMEQKFEKSPIMRCEGCNDLIPESLSLRKGERLYCKPCADEGYYTMFAEIKT